MTGIIYGSTTGNTEHAAKLIVERLEDSELIPVNEISEELFHKYDMVLLGSSTWGIGELQDDWESGIEILKRCDFSGKKVGFFGCGDQQLFSDSFVDSLGILYEAVKDTAGEIVGKCHLDGYEFTASAAVVDGSFIGLPLDADNQPEMTAERIIEWVEGL